MKRIIRIALLLSGVLVVTAGAALWTAGRAGSSAVEAWVAGQIQLVADSYLTPRLSFVDLDYEFPLTVRLKSLRLTADDPANAGSTIDILGCDEAEIELAEIPQAGQPIRIASIVLNKPLFQAVRAGDGTPSLVGFSNLIKQNVTVTTRPGDGGAPKLSEFLAMKSVRLIDGRIVSDARLPGVPPMEIDRINTRLAVEREGAGGRGGGWYKLDTRITREPILDLSITGRLNLDTFTAADAEILLRARISRADDGFLPSELQKFLRDHEIQGALEAKITGSLPLLDAARGQVEMQAMLEEANIAFGDYRVPVESLVLSAALEEGVLTLSQLEISALRGGAQARGTLALMSPSLDADLRIVVNDMLLDDTIKDGTIAAREPKFGGCVNAQLAAAVPLKLLATTQPVTGTWGRGRIDVDQGRLVHVPVVQGLGRAITKSTSWLTKRPAGKGKGSDRAHVSFTLNDRQVRCSEMTYVGDVFAARGRGTVGFDQKLDLIVNGGPLEKMQHLMGRHVGGVFGKVTDALASYHVTGVVGQPEVSVQLAGGHVNRVGQNVKNGIGKVVGGVSNLAGANGDEVEP